MSFKYTEIGKIPVEWDVKMIQEIGEVVSGGTPKTKEDSYWDGNISWITPKDLSSFTERYIEVGERSITELGLKNSSAKLLPKGTVLFSSRAPIGYLAIARKELCTNQGFKNIVCDKKYSSNEFLFYMLKAKKNKIESIAGGSTFKEVSGKVVKEFKIPIPPLNEQKAIAHILSTLDDKIEVNNQINKTLENMAQAIFKQWFVDFEFPNEDGEPYKSSGGEMVESELGLIPKGWGVGEISDVVEFLGGFSFMSKDYLETGKYKVITIKNVLDGKFDSSSVKYLDIIPEKVKDVQKLEKGDILMSLTGNVARVCIVSENDCLLNQRVAKIQEKSRFSRGYIYVLFRSQLVKEILLAIAKGTAQLNLSPVEAQKMKIIIPCDKVIDKISVIYDSLFNLLLQSTDEIKLLEKFRDSLLPKLMSGEIRVPMDEEGDAS